MIRLSGVGKSFDGGRNWAVHEVDLAVPADENALIQASGRGHLAVVQALVARGADVNTRIWADGSLRSPDGEWRSPLRMARRGGHAAVVAFLEARGARD